MSSYLKRSKETPVRVGLTWNETWQSVDQGLIWCWESGRLIREKDPEIAKLCGEGELVTLVWKRCTFKYLAQWQGIRGEDLNIELDAEHVLVCTKTGKRFVFKATLSNEEIES